MAGVGEAARLYAEGRSLPQLSNALNLPVSTIRSRLVKAGITLRTRAEATRQADGLGSGLRGKKRPPRSAEWCDRIAAARLRHAEAHAVGTTIKPDGWVEITRGPHKGRGLHCVVAETLLDRPLAPGEVVHHIDLDRANNTPTNLMVLTNSEHVRLHRWWDQLHGREQKRGPNGRFGE